MAVPKYKKSKSKTRQRVSEWEKLDEPSLSDCSNCGEAKHPHQVCMDCGYYDGRQVISVSDSED
ncbi:MAG: 50S ribosomal protein L32 [bacterium]